MSNTPTQEADTQNKPNGKTQKKRGFITKTLRLTGVALQLRSYKRAITVPITYAWRPIPLFWKLYCLMFKTEYFKYGEDALLSEVSKTYLKGARIAFFLATAEITVLIWRYESLPLLSVITFGLVMAFTLSMSIVMFKSYKKVRNSEIKPLL